MKLTKFHILLLCVFLLAIFTRIYALFKSGGIIHPDELYQYIEQPYRLIFGYGTIPWEFVEGARSWFYPLIIYLIFKTSILFGFNEINQMIFFTRLFSGILSILLVYVVYLIGRDLYNKNIGLLAAFFTIFSAPLLLWSARVMSCIPSMFFSTLALYLFYVGLNTKDQEKTFASGIMLGISFMFHFSSIIFLIPMLAYALIGNYSPRYFLSGFVVVFLFQGVLDLVTWGQFLHSPITFFKINIMENRSSLFGTEPTLFYLYPLILHLPLLFFFPYAIERGRNTKYLFLNFGLYFLILSLIPHKEERFIFPILPIFFVLSGRGFEKFIKRLPRIESIALTIGLIVSLLLISPFNTNIYNDAIWTPFSDNLNAMQYIGSQNDSKGVAYTMEWGVSGVYTYLHKNITAIYLTTNTTLCQQIYQNRSKYTYYIPVGFQCNSIEDILNNLNINYVVISSPSLEMSEKESTLFHSNFTEAKAFGKVKVFRRLNSKKS